MIITKDLFTIRSAELSDAEQLNNWWNDGAVMAHAGFPLGLGESIEETKKQIEMNKTKLSQRCIIEYSEKAIGEMSFTLLGKEVAEIGIKICESNYQNKGFGSIFIRMMVDYLFYDLNLNSRYHVKKIILDTNLDNMRAQHVYEKIGFEKVRVNVNVWKDQLGNMQSSVDYELKKENWPKN